MKSHNYEKTQNSEKKHQNCFLMYSLHVITMIKNVLGYYRNLGSLRYGNEYCVEYRRLYGNQSNHAVLWCGTTWNQDSSGIRPRGVNRTHQALRFEGHPWPGCRPVSDAWRPYIYGQTKQKRGMNNVGQVNPEDCRKDSGLQGRDIQVVKPYKCGWRGPAGRLTNVWNGHPAGPCPGRGDASGGMGSDSDGTKGSRRAATHAGPITRAVDAISCRSLERGGPVSRGSAMGLLSAAGITQTPTVGSSRGGLLESACAVVPWLAWVPALAEQLGGKHRAKGWAIRGPGHLCSLKKRLGSESCLRWRRGLLELCQSSNSLNCERVERPFLWRDIVPRQHVCSLVHFARHMRRLQWTQIVLSPQKKVVCQCAETLRDEAALVIYVWHHGPAAWAY